jgi:hypothetical protein
MLRTCKLEPCRTFDVAVFEPTIADKRHDELLARLDALCREVAGQRADLRQLNRPR